MSRTREAFRGAIDRGAPTEQEARDDFDAVLARVERSRKASFIRAVPVVSGAGFAAAAAAAIIFHASTPAGSLESAHAPDTAIGARAEDSPSEMSVYLRRSNEPEDKAFSLSLKLRGDQP
jgi:hypothetical protein